MTRTIHQALLAFVATTMGCALESDPTGSKGAAVGPKPPVSTLTLAFVDATQTTIRINVCAGATGAPAGFSVHWIESSVLGAGGAWPSSDTAGFCDASFSGSAAGSRFALEPYACTTVVIGDLATEPGASWSCNDALKCGTQYAFRAFAHANSDMNRSDWSTTLLASTEACSNGCTYTQGFWKTHTPFASKPALSLSWPVSSLSLGSVSYTDAQIIQMFDTPPSGNGLVSLAHQLAAAKLNIASGASSSSISSTIAAADTLIGARIVPSVGTGYLSPSSTSSLTSLLTQFNEGTIGPGHCEDKPTYSVEFTPTLPPLPRPTLAH
ncbi:MAG: hypothetical protein ACXWUG_18275 [Polyangiales bacterium]